MRKIETKKIETPFSEEIAIELHAGDRVELSGYLYTARDAAHKRLYQALRNGEELPIDLRDQTLFYTGPSPTPPGAIIGSAGPTTSYRMDGYTPELLRKVGLRGMIGKGNRSKAVIDAMIQTKAVYFAAFGGAGALIARHIEAVRPVCYEELGPEAMYRLTIRALPLIVAIDTKGNNLYIH